MRPAFQYGFLRGAVIAGAALNSFGKFPPRDLKVEADADVPVFVGERRLADSYPAPDGKLTFDKLSSVYLSGNKTRDDAPPHIRVQPRVRREVAEAWVNMCPAQVYEIIGRREPGRERRDRRGDGRELRPVRRHHGEGRPAHAGRGRLGPRVPRDVGRRVAVDVVAASAAIGNRLRRTPLRHVGDARGGVRRRCVPEVRALPEDGLLQDSRRPDEARVAL